MERNTKATKLLEEGRNKEWLERNTKATKLLEEGRNKECLSATPRLPSC